MVAARLTEVPGASAVFGCGIVSYNNTVKAEVLGVDPAVIERHTAVSAETAAAMAGSRSQKIGADIGIGTGNAGPSASEGQPVGLVFVAVASEKYSHVSRLFHRPPMPTPGTDPAFRGAQGFSLICCVRQGITRSNFWPVQDPGHSPPGSPPRRTQRTLAAGSGCAGNARRAPPSAAIR